ncbi:hypothetical protein Tco_0870065 [Tanacetum coccineum]
MECLFKLPIEMDLHYVVDNGPWMGVSGNGWVHNGFQYRTEICYRDSGKNTIGVKKVKVEYSCKPYVGKFCFVFGHDEKECSKRPKFVKEFVEREMKENELKQQKEEFILVRKKEERWEQMGYNSEYNKEDGEILKEVYENKEDMLEYPVTLRIDQSLSKDMIRLPMRHSDKGFLISATFMYLDVLSFRVFNTRRQQIEETYHVTFDESIEANRHAYKKYGYKFTTASASKCRFANILSGIEPKKHQSPSPNKDQPESSHAEKTGESNWISCSEKSQDFDNYMLITERQLVSNLRNLFETLFAQVAEDNLDKHEEVVASYADLRAVVEGYYEENAGVDERAKLLKAFNKVSETLKANSALKEAMKRWLNQPTLTLETSQEEPEFNQRLLQATEGYIQNSNRL